MPSASDGPVVAVVGPTAAGKSDLAVALALAIGGEVVNADSMQLYRGMDIGTAKLPEDQRRGVPHHLLDVLDVTQTASVAAYQRAARDVIAGCHTRGVVPVLVGGSALYVRAVVDRLEFPGTDPAVRERLEAELESMGAAAMHARLAAVDPAAAAAVLPGNGRRIVRALEVVELTGSFSAVLPEPAAAYDRVTLIGLDVPRMELDRRVDARVGAMWSEGLVDEVRRLEVQGLRQGRTASRALGYAQVLAYLAGESTEATAREETARRTRRFVRRQDAWFRRDHRVRWLSAGEEAARASEAASDLVGQAVSGAEEPLRPR
ncbi:MAG: tRNA dimethylallyltransferase [uncultured Nocardioidaceae bacterium]|uniref:tRNA dimethylallyltransferase n=1 Tax=uncultured Nocardioidaceae bacterium TaxID=253824 RepID=A0A6J4L3K1_9ACTN|nr:MAG: tRNA dimethylallyltransferase [uncultured Nocardioidaceae bacterium]